MLFLYQAGTEKFQRLNVALFSRLTIRGLKIKKVLFGWVCSKNNIHSNFFLFFTRLQNLALDFLDRVTNLRPLKSFPKGPSFPLIFRPFFLLFSSGFYIPFLSFFAFPLCFFVKIPSLPAF